MTFLYATPAAVGSRVILRERDPTAAKRARHPKFDDKKARQKSLYRQGCKPSWLEPPNYGGLSTCLPISACSTSLSTTTSASSSRPFPSFAGNDGPKCAPRGPTPSMQTAPEPPLMLENSHCHNEENFPILRTTTMRIAAAT